MTYKDSNDLMNDPTFRGRVKVSCLKFADSIMIEASTAPAHNSRLRWASNCFQQPDNVAQQVTPPTVMDGAVQDAGAAITDDALQGSVEAVINKMI